jgi:hypothetical protein
VSFCLQSLPRKRKGAAPRWAAGNAPPTKKSTRICTSGWICHSRSLTRTGKEGGQTRRVRVYLWCTCRGTDTGLLRLYLFVVTCSHDWAFVCSSGWPRLLVASIPRLCCETGLSIPIGPLLFFLLLAFYPSHKGQKEGGPGPGTLCFSSFSRWRSP